MAQHSKITDPSLRNPVCLAEITSPHGVRGAVKIKTFTEYSEDIFNYPTLRDCKGQVYNLSLFAPKHNDLLVVVINGIGSRTEAESLRGTRLYVDRCELPEIDDNEFYYEDLVGAVVIDQSDATVGTILAVQNYGAGDFFDIRALDGEIYTLPFTKEAVPAVDLGGKRIVINKDYLLGGK